MKALLRWKFWVQDLLHEKGCEEEREGSPVPIFPPPSFGIGRLLTGWMGFCFKISGMWVERGSFSVELMRKFYIEFGVLLITSFWVVEEAFIPHDINLVFWLGLLLFREEFGMLLAWFWKQSYFLFMATVFSLCRPWKTKFGWLSGLGYSTFFLESTVFWCGKWRWVEN